MNAEKKVFLLAGPTASGKTRLSLDIAQFRSVEIVCADSRQIFRTMNIGTAKPTVEEMSLVPHHCIDLCTPDQYFSAGEYAQVARSIIHDILQRGHLPLVVGGSGLYIQALVDGIFQGNFRDPLLRRALYTQAQDHGWSVLYEELLEVDPLAAKIIHKHDQKRIIRALEVYRLTGRPISKMKEKETVAADFIPVFIGLQWPREALYHRIELRVDQMIQDGLVDEVRHILDMGYDRTLNSLDSVGYKEIIAYLYDEISLEEAVIRIKQNTRRYAKRQITWFKRDKRIHWLDIQNMAQMPDITQQSLRFI